MLAKDPARRPTAAQVANGVPPPIMAEPEVDAVPTRALPVRRKPVLAGAVAAVALAASATLGILLETTGLELPTTNDLSPGNGVATSPSVVPRTSPTARPATVRPSPRPTSVSAHKPSVTRGHNKAKAGTGDKAHKAGKSGGPGKSKKPKR